MPAQPTGTVFKTKRNGYGIRWPEDGRKPQQSGFRTKTEAREWFNENVRPRLSRGGPSPEITFEDFCELFLERHGATVASRTKATLVERLAPARKHFGAWKLSELEGAGLTLPPGGRRCRGGPLPPDARAPPGVGDGGPVALPEPHPAIDAGRNPKPRREELQPFTPEEVAALAVALGPMSGALVVFVAETGLRTNEWVALERKDLDRPGAVVSVQRRYAGGVLRRSPRRRDRAAACP